MIRTDSPYFGSDDREYDERALSAINEEAFGYTQNVKLYNILIPGYSHASKYYTAIVLTIYQSFKIFGLSITHLLPVYFNSFLVAFTGIVAWRLSILMGMKSTSALFAGLLVGVWPSYVFLSAMIRRDTIFTFFVVLSAYKSASLISNKKKNTIGDFLLLGISIYIVSMFRIHYWILYIFILFSLFIGWILHSKNAETFFSRSFIILMLFVLLIAGASSFEIQSDILLSINRIPEYYESYSKWRSNEQHGGGIGSYLFTLPVSLSIPARLIYGQISPPPVPTLKNITFNYYWMGTIIWYFCIPTLIGTVATGLKSKSYDLFSLKVTIIFFLTFMLVAQTIAFSELHGLGGRLLGVVVIVYGLEKQSKSIYSTASYMFIIALFLALSYLSVKYFL